MVSTSPLWHITRNTTAKPIDTRKFLLAFDITLRNPKKTEIF